MRRRRAEPMYELHWNVRHQRVMRLVSPRRALLLDGLRLRWHGIQNRHRELPHHRYRDRLHGQVRRDSFLRLHR
jgi:hypothetical protein